jgi:hypothetical protein
MIIFKYLPNEGIEFQIPENYENVVSNDAADTSLNKTVIKYDTESKNLLVRVAIGNPVPLFWAWTERGFILSDYIPLVLGEISDEFVSVDALDPVGLLESILFDCPLVDRTLYKNIKKTQMGEELYFCLSTKTLKRKWLWLPSVQGGDSNSKEGTIHKQAQEHISNLISSYSIPDQGLVLPITGGLDSRLLGTILRAKSTSPIHSYTFQRGWSVETWCAKKVAKTLSLRHQTVNLDESCYKKFSAETATRSGGLISAMHTHGIYCCEKALPPGLSQLQRVFGYFGDPITGAMTELLSEEEVRLEGVDRVLEKYNKTIFPAALEKYKDAVIADLDETFRCYKNSGSRKGTFHEFWKIQQRQNGLITHLFNYHRAVHGVKVIQPFINREFADFFLSLSIENRENRNLFKQVCNQMYPEIFRLPSMHFHPGSLMSRLETVLEKAELAMNRINIKQEIFLNPFKYEQHEKNLINYLNDEILTGKEICEDIFGVKSKSFGFPLWKYNTTAKEGYRLSMLGHLVNR